MNTEWTVRILNHVGYVDVIDDNGQGLPHQPYLRARIIINLSQPLIPGCFLPLDDNRATWVYFRYEGIYKFCKECGCVGHHTGCCNLSAFDAQRIIRRRLHEFEDHGMTTLQAPSEIPLYTNMIRGLSDRFINRNPREDLVQRTQPFDRRDDPYRFPNQDPNGTETSEFSSNEFMEPVSPLRRRFSTNSNQNSDAHTNPPPNFSNTPPTEHTPSDHPANRETTPPPGRRFGVFFEPMAVLEPHSKHLQPIDLNLRPPNPNPNSPQENTQNRHTNSNPDTEHPPSHRLFSHMGLSSGPNDLFVHSVYVFLGKTRRGPLFQPLLWITLYIHVWNRQTTLPTHWRP